MRLLRKSENFALEDRYDCYTGLQYMWVTLALNSQLYYLNELVDKGITIASCFELKNEIDGVLLRPKFEKFFSKSYIAKVIEIHNSVTTNYKIDKISNVTSDPKDDYLFALAVISSADYLVTGDKLLLEVVKYKTTELISLAMFKNIIT